VQSIVWSTQGKTVYTDLRECRHLFVGRHTGSRDGFRSEGFFEAIHEEDLPRYQKLLERSALTRDVFDCQFRIQKRDGQFIWMHARSAPRQQADGTTVWDGIMRDITAERQAPEALQRAKETAEAVEHVVGEERKAHLLNVFGNDSDIGAVILCG
jgi:PAS domain-containing protein